MSEETRVESHFEKLIQEVVLTEDQMAFIALLGQDTLDLERFTAALNRCGPEYSQPQARPLMGRGRKSGLHLKSTLIALKPAEDVATGIRRGAQRRLYYIFGLPTNCAGELLADHPPAVR